MSHRSGLDFLDCDKTIFYECCDQDTFSTSNLTFGVEARGEEERPVIMATKEGRSDGEPFTMPRDAP